jgi:hypothetical protein
LNVTWIGMSAPTPYVPSGAVEFTPVTAGAGWAAVSMTMLKVPDRDPAVPGAGRVRLAAIPLAASVMVAPVRPNGVVDV